MNILIAADHAGYHLKENLKQFLTTQSELRIEKVEDFGTHSAESMDYPDVVHPLCKALKDEPSQVLGILICGSGNGVCMTANKYPHVRAALCWNGEIAALARKHNNANILCLPARFLSENEAFHITLQFLTHSFEGGRHQKRIQKIPC